MTGKSLPRAVIDTNVFVSAFLHRGGNPDAILEAFYEGRFIHVTTYSLIEELAQVLHRPIFHSPRYGLSSAEVQTFLAYIGLHSITVEPTVNPPLTSRDPKDDKFLQAAFEGNVDYLVTGDSDLLVLRENPQLEDLKIVTAVEFLTLI